MSREQTSGFGRSVGVVIGIDRYAPEIPDLRTAVRDARRIGALLEHEHGYDVTYALDGEATLAGLTRLFVDDLPSRLGPDDRLFLYYAGHGVALDGDDGPNGYLLPCDARRQQPSTFLHMPFLHDALLSLDVRHVLVVLDSCFAGAFRWSAVRSAWASLPDVIHQERYERYVRDPAWQVISSASHDQEALDQLSTGPLGSRGESGRHSPFALALFEALEGAADVVPAGGGDGVITATELYLYLESRLQPESMARGHRQTPRLWPLQKHDKGEFIFLVPGHELNLPPAPALTYERNPYRGLQSYEQQHAPLFFGRADEIAELRARIADQPLTVVLGASGTGKSSLVKAGLLPSLSTDEATGWEVRPVVRPGTDPMRALFGALGGDPAAPVDATACLEILRESLDQRPQALHVLVVDQLEELVTLTAAAAAQAEFVQTIAEIVAEFPERVRVILTLRSDFEPSFVESALSDVWRSARYIVPPLDFDDLRQVIEGPASERVLYFDEPELVTALISEVVQAPGALPLLSFTLSEMYIRYVNRESDDRALTRDDYEALGGVIGALRFRANEEFLALDTAHRDTMRRVMLRMISFEGGALTKRRVTPAELEYPTAEENERVRTVIRRLGEQRLVVEGTDASGDPHVEPAHDALVTAWDRLLGWIHEEERSRTDLHVQRRLTDDAMAWSGSHESGLLWRDAARSALLRRLVRQGDVAPWLNAMELRFARKSIARWRTIIAASAIAAIFIVGLAATTTVGFVQARGATRAAADSAVVAQGERDRATAAEQAALDSARVANSERDRATAAEEAARDSADVARTQRTLAENRLGESYWQQAGVAQAAGRTVEAAHLLALAASTSPDAERRRAAARGIRDLVGLYRLEVVLPGFSEMPVEEDLVPSIPPRFLLSPDRSIVLIVNPSEIRAYDLATGDVIGPSPTIDHLLMGVEFLDDTRILTWGGSPSPLELSGQATTWDLRTGEPTYSPVQQLGLVFALQRSDDGTRALTSSRGAVQYWDLATGRMIRPAIFLDHPEPTAALVNAGTGIVTKAGDDCRLWAVDANGGAAGTPSEAGWPEPTRVECDAYEGILPAGPYDDEEEPFVAPRLGDHEILYAPGERDPLVVRNTRDGTTVVLPHDGRVWQAEFLDEDRVISSSGDGTVRVWRLFDPPGALARLSLSDMTVGAHDGKLQVRYTERDTTWTRFWSADALEPLGPPMLVAAGRGSLYSGSVANRRGDRVFVWRETSARLNDPSSGAIVFGPVALGAEVRQATFSPEGSSILVLGRDDRLRVLDARTGRLRGENELEGLDARFVFDPSGRRFVTVTDDRTTWIRDARTGEPVSPEIRHRQQINGAAYSPSGRWLLTWSADSTAQIRSATDGTVAHVLRHDEPVIGASFSDDGSRIVTITGDYNIGAHDGPSAARVWDTVSGRPLTSPFRQDNVLTGFRRLDDRRFVTWSLDSRAVIWDRVLDDSVAIMELPSPVSAIDVSEDGSRLLTWTGDGQARVWRTADGEPLTGTIEIGGNPFVNTARARFWPGTGWVTTSNHAGEISFLDPDDATPLARPIRGPSSLEWIAPVDGGRRLLAKGEGALALWAVLGDADFPEDALPDLVRARTGTTLGGRQQLRFLGADEWRAAYRATAGLLDRHARVCRYPDGTWEPPAAVVPRRRPVATPAATRPATAWRGRVLADDGGVPFEDLMVAAVWITDDETVASLENKPEMWQTLGRVGPTGDFEIDAPLAPPPPGSIVEESLDEDSPVISSAFGFVVAFHDRNGDGAFNRSERMVGVAVLQFGIHLQADAAGREQLRSFRGLPNGTSLARMQLILDSAARAQPSVDSDARAQPSVDSDQELILGFVEEVPGSPRGFVWILYSGEGEVELPDWM